MWGQPGGFGGPGGYGQPGGFGQPGFHQPGFGQPGFVQPGFGGQGGFSFQPGMQWGYDHDNQLRNQIEIVFQQFDRNRSGYIDNGEFFPAYCTLCQMTGQAAPHDFYQIQNIARQTDQNFDGRISRQEMFMLFKRAQFGLF